MISFSEVAVVVVVVVVVIFSGEMVIIWSQTEIELSGIICGVTKRLEELCNSGKIVFCFMVMFVFCKIKMKKRKINFKKKCVIKSIKYERMSLSKKGKIIISSFFLSVIIEKKEEYVVVVVESK